MSAYIECLRWSFGSGRSRRALSRRRNLAVLLALAVVFCVWVESEHITELELHHSGAVCATCLFTGGLGCGLAPSLPMPASSPPAAAPVQDRVAIFIPFHFRSSHSQRGPPLSA